MKYDKKEVFEINNPKDVFLPTMNISSKYILQEKIAFLLIQITIIIMLIITKKLFNTGVYLLKK